MWWRELAAQDAGPFSVDEAVTIHPLARVHAEATLDASHGPIRIGSGTVVCKGAHLVGPVEIGSDCLIGNLAMIRGASRIGNGTRIGFATEVKHALIGERVSIGPQCFVADTKIEDEAYLGAQVRTSNHRLDGKTVAVMADGELVDTGLEKLGCLIGRGAALGIQVIVLPGREIAPGSIFAPRVTVEKNLPAGRYRTAQNLELF